MKGGLPADMVRGIIKRPSLLVMGNGVFWIEIRSYIYWKFSQV